MVEVTWLDDADEKALTAVAEMVSEFEQEVVPGEPETPPAELDAQLRHVPYHQRVSIAVATDGGRPVGTAHLAVSDVAGAEDLAEVEFLIVRPECRRAGLGRALLGAVSDRAGRRRIRGYAPTAHPGGMGFASAVGAVPGLVDQQNRVSVAALDRDMLEGWVRRAGERASGYSLVAFDGPCPDDLLERFTRLTHVMNTAPRSPGDEGERPTAAETAASDEARRRRTGWAWTACARHDATGDLVGYTALMATTTRPWLAQQWDTGVEPAHRNRGLGRWLKAANALRLLDERPEVTTVETWNAGVNAAMLSINHAMGFRPAAEWQEWTLERG